MRLIVLGVNGSFPGPGGACSGYLLESGGQWVLIDCGSGVISRAQRYCPVEDLTAIALSHLHSDHMADLLVLRYGLETRRALGQRFTPLPVYHPATPSQVAAELDHGGVFEQHTSSDGLCVQVGPLQVRFVQMVHTAESYALVIEAEGKKLVYSGDTVYNPRLVEAAQGADLFLCESTALASKHPPGAALPHLTARQAGEAAAQAGVGRLLLTHFWYLEPRQNYLDEARQAFANVTLAEEFAVYLI